MWEFLSDYAYLPSASPIAPIVAGTFNNTEHYDQEVFKEGS